MKKNKLSTRSIAMAISIIAVVFTVAVLGRTMQIVNNNELNAKSFSEGVTISGVQVGGLTKEKAYKSVATNLGKKINNMNLKITYKDKEWNLTVEDFTLQPNVKKVVDEAYDYNNKILNNDSNIQLETIDAEGMKIETKFDYLFMNLENTMSDIINQIEIEPVSSKVNYDPERNQMFKFSESKEGLKVNKEKLYKDLEKEFIKDSANMNVEISAVKVPPKVTKKFLKDKTKLVSSFNTSLYNSKERRVHNVAFAFSKFNGLTVKPDETVSFNALTSPQTLEGGYKKSIIILNGVFVEGVGGGLCQASTTLYNACLLAGLEILEVNKHTLPVGYVELGFDAMVSENWSDFVFKNNSPYNIYLKCYVKDDLAHAEIYGKTLDNGVKLVRRAEFVKTIPHRGDVLREDKDGEYASRVLYKGERFRVKYPREGYEAKGYIQYYSGGQLVKEVKVRHEIYEPQPGLVVEGAEEPPEGYTIPKSEIKLIPPQKLNETEGESIKNISSILLRDNPTSHNP